MTISAKRIKEYFGEKVSDQTAKEISAITKLSYTPARLQQIDKLLETCGVEFIEHPTKSTYNDMVGLEYCNSGDTYWPTIGYDTVKGKWYIGTWGDWYEKNGGLDN